jgi:hypothetical protein
LVELGALLADLEELALVEAANDLGRATVWHCVDRALKSEEPSTPTLVVVGLCLAISVCIHSFIGMSMLSGAAYGAFVVVPHAGAAEEQKYEDGPEQH